MEEERYAGPCRRLLLLVAVVVVVDVDWTQFMVRVGWLSSALLTFDQCHVDSRDWKLSATSVMLCMLSAANVRRSTSSWSYSWNHRASYLEEYVKKQAVMANSVSFGMCGRNARPKALRTACETSPTCHCLQKKEGQRLNGRIPSWRQGVCTHYFSGT